MTMMKLSTNMIVAARDGNHPVVEAWLDSGGHVDALFDALDGSVRGMSMLMCASAYGHAPLAELLLRRKASVNLQTSKDATALIFAAIEGFTPIVRQLLQAGAAAGPPGLQAARKYSGVRLYTTEHLNAMYAEYTDGAKMYFDCTVDPWQTRNLYNDLSNETRQQLAQLVQRVRSFHRHSARLRFLELAALEHRCGVRLLVQPNAKRSRAPGQRASHGRGFVHNRIP